MYTHTHKYIYKILGSSVFVSGEISHVVKLVLFSLSLVCFGLVCDWLLPLLQLSHTGLSKPKQTSQADNQTYMLSCPETYISTFR